jgi:predicted transcriptional regulator
MDKRFFAIKDNVMDIPTDKDNLRTQGLTLFKDSPSLAYVYKKTEKIVSALYLVSDFLSDSEPMKGQLRTIGLDLLGNSLSVSDTAKLTTNLLKLISILTIAHSTRMLSEMNYQILKFELESVLNQVESSNKFVSSKGLLLSENFFSVPSPSSEPVSVPKVISKGQQEVSDRKVVKDKSNRQEIILSLLKKNQELGIKDFVLSISDCSEKTIQRELANLVAKGTIKKAGEKRWSRYSLR